jgi:hypothetical protein
MPDITDQWKTVSHTFIHFVLSKNNVISDWLIVGFITPSGICHASLV